MYAMLTPYEIVLKYSQMQVGLYNYYRNVDNLEVINSVLYILQFSCAKTIARRKKTSIAKIFSTYGKTLQISEKVGTKKYHISLKSLKELRNKQTKQRKKK